MTGVLIPTASEEAWLQARRCGVTASEIAVILGLSPWDSAFSLWHRKRGLLPGQPDNDAMALGRHMEAWIAQQFAARHPEFGMRGSGRELWRHAERPWQMATPDRTLYEDPLAINEPVAVVECKVDNGDGFGDDGSDRIPVHYRCQVLWQMDVLGVQAGFLAALIWHKRQVRVYQLHMDDGAQADLKLMREQAEAFLALESPPEPDWRPATTSALKHLHPSVEDREAYVPAGLARRYRAACAAVRKAELRKQQAENELRARMGTARRAVTGSYIVDGRGDLRADPLARRDVYDLPEKQITRKAATVDRLVPVTARAKEPS